MKRLVLGLAAFIATTACGSDFEPPSRLAELRLLAVRADRPFARPGDEVALEALVVDPSSRPLSWAWATCVNPSSASVTGCLAQADWTSTTFGSSSRHRVRVPDDAVARLPGSARAAAVVGVLVVVCPGVLTPAPEARPAPLRCTGAGGRVLALEEVEIGMKRVFVRLDDTNANPTIDAVAWDGAPWAEDEVKEATACPTVADRFDDCDEGLAHRVEVRAGGPTERGVDELGAAFDEQTVVQLYATDGIFEHPVRVAASPVTRWVARGTTPPGATIDFWFVVRDDRGGVAWTKRRARVRP